MPRVVITEFMDDASVARITDRFSTHYDPALVDQPDAIAALLADAEALVVRNRTQVTDALLAAGPRLKVVGRLGVGLDNIDTEAAKARRIPVVPATGANDDSVAEYVIASAMILLRGAYRSSAEMMAGSWPRTRLMGREIMGKTLGLVGFGAIARETARRAEALGMTIAAFDPFLDLEHPVWRGVERHETLETLLFASDVVSLHVPLTDATRNLIDRAALSAMRSNAVLINAARGGVVDEMALVEALRLGLISGAALDVFEREPLAAEAGAVFRGCSNLILTPHIAGVTVESNERVGKVIADAVIRYLEA